MQMAVPDSSKFILFCHMFYYKEKQADPLNRAAAKEAFVCASYISGL